MPRIDPHQLLTCLGVLLTPSGGIKSKDEVQRLVNLMTKYSKKLVSKCIYILILKNTDTELLGQFMSVGGWNLTHVWLTDGIYNENWALVSELLELMLMCPVDVERLKANNCPKLVKGLSKDGSPEGVRVLASKLVEQWLRVVKGETQIANTHATQSIVIEPPPIQQVTVPTSSIQSIEISKSDNVIPTVNGEDRPITANDKNSDAVSEVYEQESTTLQNTIYRIKVRDGKQIITRDSVLNKSEDLNINIDTKSEKDKKESNSLNRDKEKDRSKHSSSTSSSSRHSSSKSSNSSRKSSSSSSSRKDKNRDRNKSKSSSNSSSSSSSSNKSKDKHRPNGISKKTKSNDSSVRDNKEKQAEKDQATLAKLQPQSISKIGRIPKKALSDEDKKDKKSSSNNSKVESKKPSISIEVRKHDSDLRPKTVKVFNAKMRSTGLEEEAKPPPPRPVPRKLPPPKRLSPPKDSKDIIKPPPEKKAKILDSTLDVDRPGGIKLIEAKPKPAGLQECGFFMDAMVAASVNNKKDPKKKKRRISVSKEDGAPGGKLSSPPSSPSVTNTGANSPLMLKPQAPKFYKDTLETDEEGDIKSTTKLDLKEPIHETEGTNSESETNEKYDTINPINESSENQSKNSDSSSPRDSTDNMFDFKNDDKKGKGVLVHVKRKGPKKTVKWKADAELEDIQYFELDETERVNVTKTFTDMKQIEVSSEREALMSRKLTQEDLMDERITWRPLIRIDLTPDLVALGKNSREKDIQFAREKVILQAIYFHRSMIPDSPTEPDVEHHQMEDPIVIPLDDVAGNPDNIKDYTSTPWPDPKGDPPEPSFPTQAPSFNSMQPQFMGPPSGPPFPPNIPNHFSAQPGFINNPIMGGDWRTGDGRVMPLVPDVNMAPEIFNPMGGIPPNMFPGAQPPPPDNYNMTNNMNGPFPPMGFNTGPGMFPGPGFQDNRGGNNMRGRNRAANGPWYRNSGPNNWKGGNWGNRGICKHFQRSGYCRQGDKCQFLHPGVNCPPFE